MIHMWRPQKLPIFQDPPPPLSIYVQNSSTTLTWDIQFQMNPSPLQMITNQLKENIIQGWLLYVTRSLLQVGFPFRYQLINLVWLSFDYFSFSCILTLCFFVALYSCVYSGKRKRPMEQQPPRACQSKNKTKYVTFELITRSIVRFSSQTMHWCHWRMASLLDVRVK